MVVIKQYCAKLNGLLYGEMEKNGRHFKHMSFSSLGLEVITHEDSYFICSMRSVLEGTSCIGLKQATWSSAKQTGGAQSPDCPVPGGRAPA